MGLNYTVTTGAGHILEHNLFFDIQPGTVRLAYSYYCSNNCTTVEQILSNYISNAHSAAYHILIIIIYSYVNMN